MEMMGTKLDSYDDDNEMAVSSRVEAGWLVL